MSCTFRNAAMGRHPALNRMPRDFLSEEGVIDTAAFYPTPQE